MSGEVAAGQNTLALLKWVLSWFVALKASQIAEINAILRKIGHALAYGIMYFLWFRAFRGQLGVGSGRAWLYAVGLCLLVSMTDEGHQSFTQSRGGSGYDVLLDLSGSNLAALITFAVWTPRGNPGVIAGPAGQQAAGPR
jgi:VanZ family protein